MALPFTDNFNRANADPIGGNWTINPSGTGSARIASNQVANSTTGAGVKGAYVNSETFPNNQYVQCKRIAGSANDGPTIRQDVAADSHYRCAIRNVTTLRVFKRVTGTDTQLGGDYTVTTLTSSDVVKIRVSGTSLVLSINGVDQGASQSDSALASGNAGLFWITTGSGIYDDFEAGAVASTAAGGWNGLTLAAWNGIAITDWNGTGIHP